MIHYDKEKYCAWCGFREASDEHHIFRRSTSPGMIDDPENKVRLCRICHRYATEQKEVEQMFQHYFFLKEKEPEISIGYIARMMRDQEYLSPRDVTRYRSYLAAEYQFGSEQMVELEKQRPFLIEKLRHEVKSDKRAEVKYDMTPEGQAYNAVKSALKSMEKLMSALRTVHEQYQSESKNIF